LLAIFSTTNHPPWRPLAWRRKGFDAEIVLAASGSGKIRLFLAKRLGWVNPDLRDREPAPRRYEPGRVAGIKTNLVSGRGDQIQPFATPKVIKVGPVSELFQEYIGEDFLC
jgi:hypothetical protein